MSAMASIYSQARILGCLLKYSFKMTRKSLVTSLLFITLVQVVFVTKYAWGEGNENNVIRDTFSIKPSNFIRGKESKVRTNYCCYFRRRGLCDVLCGITHKVIGPKQPIDDLNNNGGHLHDFGTRPVIGPSGELQFDGDDSDPSKLGVKSFSNTDGTAGPTVTHVMPDIAGKIITEDTLILLGTFSCGPTCYNDRTVKFESTVDVKIKGLIELPPAPELYIRCAKTGGCVSDSPDGDSNHDSPFYGNPRLVNAIIGLAAMYRSLFPSSEPNGNVLRITDMGLKFGGLFDLRADWKQPHKGHQDGSNADISRSFLRDSDKATEFLDQKILDTLVMRLGIDRLTEDSTSECPILKEEEPPCIHITVK